MKNTDDRTYRSVFRKTIVVIAISGVASAAHAWDVPSNLRDSDDALTWDSDAPSYNIYEDGNYIATVHGVNRFEPIFDNSLYQVVAHDYGKGFTAISSGYFYTDDEDDDDVSDDGEDIQFDEAELYVELNNTDGDLGIHSVIDGDAWKSLTYEDVNGRTLLNVQLTGAMAEQGLTEFFFESAEPTFDEVSPAEFFARFPSGTYDVEGITIEGDEIEAETQFSHVLPAPTVVRVGANASSSIEGCNDNPALDPSALLDISGGLPVEWDPILTHHPEIGASGEVEVAIYQFVYEGQEVKLTIDLDADTTSYTVPASLVKSGDFGKLEVIVRDATYNQVGTEACFRVM